MLRTQHQNASKSRHSTKRPKISQRLTKKNNHLTLTNRPMTVTTATISTPSRRSPTHTLNHAMKNLPLTTAPHHTPKRNMAFSFNQVTSYANITPLSRPALPWEKHHTDTTKTLVNSPLGVGSAPPQALPPSDQNVQIQTTPTLFDQNPQTEPSQTTSKFSFSQSLHVNHISRQHAAEHDPTTAARTVPPPRETETDLVPQSKLTGRLIAAIQPTLDSYNKSDLTNVAVNDLDSMFKNSTMSGVFSQQHHGPTFWNEIQESPTLYFIGTRQITPGAGQPFQPTYAFMKRHVNKPMRTIKDEFTTYDFRVNKPFKSTVVTTLESDLSRGRVHEVDADIGPETIQRTVLRLRGVPWKWHASVQMTQITTDASQLPPGQEPDEDTYTATRSKFTQNGFIAEKLVRNGDRLTATVIDDMKIVDRQTFNQRLEQAMNGDTTTM